MKSVLKFLLIISLGLLFACDEPVEKPNPYAQENIPWPSLADSPWPIERHDAQGTGRSTNEGPTSPADHQVFRDSLWLWSESSLVFGEHNQFYFIGAKAGGNYLYCISSDLNVEWLTNIDQEGSNGTTPTLAADGKLYATSVHTGNVHAVNSNNGSILWSVKVADYINSDVSLDIEGNLYLIGGSPSMLISLSPDGQVRWSISANKPFVNSGEVSVVFDPQGHVLYTTTVDSLYAVDINGSILWSYWTKETIIHVMVCNAGNIYFTNPADNTITCLYPDGSIRWKTSLQELGYTRGSEWFAPTIDFSGNLYFAVTRNDRIGGILSLDNEGQHRWFHATNISTHIISDRNNNIFWAAGFGLASPIMKAASPSGNLLWEYVYELNGGAIQGSPAVTKDRKLSFPIMDNGREIALAVY